MQLGLRWPAVADWLPPCLFHHFPPLAFAVVAFALVGSGSVQGEVSAPAELCALPCAVLGLLLVVISAVVEHLASLLIVAAVVVVVVAVLVLVVSVIAAVVVVPVLLCPAVLPRLHQLLHLDPARNNELLIQSVNIVELPITHSGGMTI